MLVNIVTEQSLLARFRTRKLKENTLDKINTEIIRQCVEKGIIHNTGISIDTLTQKQTHLRLLLKGS